MAITRRALVLHGADCLGQGCRRADEEVRVAVVAGGDGVGSRGQGEAGRGEAVAAGGIECGGAERCGAIKKVTVPVGLPLPTVDVLTWAVKVTD